MHSRCTERCACHEISTNGSRGQWRPCPGGSVTAPATKSALQVHRVLRLPHKRQPRPSGDHTRRSWLCVLRLRNFGLQVHRLLCLPRNLLSRFTNCCACHTKRRAPLLVREALCTAYHEICTPGAQSAVPATKSPFQVHQVLCLPVAQRRPRAPQLVREALCTAPATKSALQVHRVLRLPQKRQPRPSGDHARRSCSGRLCALRLPGNPHSRCTECCACHTKGSGA